MEGFAVFTDAVIWNHVKHFIGLYTIFIQPKMSRCLYLSGHTATLLADSLKLIYGKIANINGT